MKKVIVGLTGGLGTGKSTVAGLLAKQGARIIDADRIVRRLLSSSNACSRKVVKAFGKGVWAGSKIDRRKLAAIVFRSESKRRKLENIVHPFVREEMSREIKRWEKQKRRQALVLEVPLLFEVGMDGLVDVIITVYCTQQKAVERASARLKISKNEALRRIKTQMPLKEKMRLSDIIINNSTTLGKTRKQAAEAWKNINS